MQPTALVRLTIVIVFSGLIAAALLPAPGKQGGKQAVASYIAPGQPLPLDRAERDPALRANFERLTEQHGLFSREVFQEADRNGWRKEYARLVRECWKGRDQEGVSLELKATLGHVYRVGEAFRCRAFLTNHDDRPRLLQTGGSCGMTDVLTPYIISTRDGELFSCRGKVGGGHCFCRPRQSLIQPWQTVEIATGFESEMAVSWIPQEPGDYVVVGVYDLKPPRGGGKLIYSPPLVVRVVARAK